MRRNGAAKGHWSTDLHDRLAAARGEAPAEAPERAEL